MASLAFPEAISSHAPPETAKQRQQRLIALYKDRLDHLFRSFANGRAATQARLNFNESLKAGGRCQINVAVGDRC